MTQQPNVVVFLTDQQRWDSTGVHGNPLDLTPNFDRFAARGTHLSHAFTPQPVCAPARSSLQTGLYPTATGVHRNGLVLPQGVPTMAERFGDAGYETAYIGKWHLAGTSEGPVPPERRGGYEHWLAGDVVEFISDAYDTHLFDEDGTLVSLPGYRTDAYIDAAIRHLARDRDRPFFLFLSLIEPHHRNSKDDYPAPDGYAERYDGAWTPPDLEALGGTTGEHLAGYWGMVKRVDEAFGRLLEALQSLGHGDDTVVAFTSDHGCHFKTRNSEYKRSAHEASIRVPFAIDGPGFRGGGRVDRLVSAIDLPPTLLDAAGIDPPATMHGRSLLSLDPDGPDDVFVQISESQVGRAIRTPRWKYSATAPAADGWHDPDAAAYVDDLLYDLDDDPYELHNLAGDPAYAEVTAALRERLVSRMVEAGEPAPVITAGG